MFSQSNFAIKNCDSSILQAASVGGLTAVDEGEVVAIAFGGHL